MAWNNRKNRYIQRALVVLICILCTAVMGSIRVSAAGQPVTTVEELTEAMMNAQDGDTILVGDITFQPMPMGMMQVPKNLVIKSAKEENAVFTNATFALNGTANDAAPLKVRFENIDFVGDNGENGLDITNPPNVSSRLPDIMTTMCAGIFKMNLDVTYSGCSFEGYHYGYGGVFNAIYSSDDNKNELNLTLENCRFTGNAGGYGGVMYLIGRNHNITVLAKDCVLEGNAAATGGAVWAENAVLDINNCRFVENQYMEGEVERPAGGALALYNCDTVLENCVLQGNVSRERGALYCEITPFHTMVMRNCTLSGNSSSEGNAAFQVVPAETNFSTEAKAYLYFCSFAGHEGAPDLLTQGCVSVFGCLFADMDSPEEEPSEENGYCLSLPGVKALEKGIAADETGHIYLNEEGLFLPQEAVAAVANGRFAGYAGLIGPGDFDASKVNAAPPQTVETGAESGEKTGSQDTNGMQGAETGSLDAAPEKDKAPEETGAEAEGALAGVFSGSRVPAGILGILIVVCAAGAFAVWAAVSGREKAAASAGQQAGGEQSLQSETAQDLPANWIERVCGQSEIQKLLSGRELEVLPLLLEGKSREQIAKELFISESTVKKHASSIYAKLDVSGKAELIAKMAGK